MAWEWRENNREKVIEALQKGEYEAILGSRDGALDALGQLACELEGFEAIELIEVERERAGVPDELEERQFFLRMSVAFSLTEDSAWAGSRGAGVLLQLG